MLCFTDRLFQVVIQMQASTGRRVECLRQRTTDIFLLIRRVCIETDDVFMTEAHRQRGLEKHANATTATRCLSRDVTPWTQADSKHSREEGSSEPNRRCRPMMLHARRSGISMKANYVVRKLYMLIHVAWGNWLHTNKTSKASVPMQSSAPPIPALLFLLGFSPPSESSDRHETVHGEATPGCSLLLLRYVRSTN